MDETLYKEQYENQKKHWWFVAKKKIIMSKVWKVKKKKLDLQILDMGCGTGLMLSELAKVGKTSGMDFSKEAIKYAKKSYDGTILQGTLPLKVPYDKDSFDLIVSLDVIEHIDDDEKTLQVIHNLLKDGGKCILTVPACMFLWSHHDDINHHKRRYSRKELQKKILDAGFKIEFITYYNFFLFPIIYLTRLLEGKNPKNISSDVSMPSKWLNFLLEKIFSLENLFIGWLRLPIGVSLITVITKPRKNL